MSYYRAQECFELLHINICEAMQTLSCNGTKYLLTFLAIVQDIVLLCMDGKSKEI